MFKNGLFGLFLITGGLSGCVAQQGESLEVTDAGETLEVTDVGETLEVTDAGETLKVTDAGETLAAQIQDIQDVTVMENGLRIQIVLKGEGEEIKSGEVARVHYTGWLYDEGAPDGKGVKFDSSRDRGEPFAFNLGVGRVIQGWDLGVVGMMVGERRILTIPPQLGYGDRGFGPDIPPGATLLFDVELVEIRLQ
ncbi:MAG: FKBP-type peptidyl-prolyl cis-trans isomerase [Bacteroidetes bacterium]|nr:FKBP-type peptidyl-prolyl cis-trans isomerase [Bacteroidota bacterium]